MTSGSGFESLSVVIPAAGLSTRMGERNKLLLDIDGEPMVARTVRNVKEAGAQDCLIVLGCDAREVLAALPDGVRTVQCPEYRAGMGATIKAGVEAVSGGRAIMILPADMPFVRPETVRRVAAERRSARESAAHSSSARKSAVRRSDEIVVPVLNGRRGHPVLFGASFRAALLRIANEGGARSVLVGNPDTVREIAVSDPGIHTDIDTPEDLP